MSSTIVVYGGNGSLGSSCVLFFKKNGFVGSESLNSISTSGFALWAGKKISRLMLT